MKELIKLEIIHAKFANRTMLRTKEHCNHAFDFSTDAKRHN